MLILLAGPGVAGAADIKVLCSNGFRAVMQDLVPQLARATRHTVTVRYGLSTAITRQIEAGEPFDLAVLTPSLIDDLIGKGSLAGGARAAFFLGLVQRLGLTESLQSRIQAVASGEEVGASVARGDVEFGVLPVSEILPVRGLEVAGTFPADLQGYVTMVAGVSARASQRVATLELITYLMDPAVLPVITKRGMERERR